MPPGINSWIYEGKGRAPSLAWSVATEAPLVALEYARETGDLLAADESGTLSRIDPTGRVSNVTQARTPVRGLAWSDTGAGGAVLVDQTKLYWFDERLRFTSSAELPGRTSAVAIESQARYVAVALSDGLVVIHDPNRKVVRHFDAGQPFVRMRFLLDQPAIVGVAEYGLLACHHFEGDRIWVEKLFSGVGDMAITGDGKAVLLACFAMGVQCHRRDGAHLGSYQLGGTVNRVATSFVSKRIGAATIERHVFWLDTDGDVLWQGEAPDEVFALHCDPLGRGLIAGLKSGRIVRMDWERPAASDSAAGS